MNRHNTTNKNNDHDNKHVDNNTNIDYNNATNDNKPSIYLVVLRININSIKR